MAEPVQTYPAEQAVDAIHAILESKPLNVEALDQAINTALGHQGAIDEGQVGQAILKSTREKLSNILRHNALKDTMKHLTHLQKMQGLLDKTREAIARTVTPAPRPSTDALDPAREARETKTRALSKTLDDYDREQGGNRHVVRKVLRALQQNNPAQLPQVGQVDLNELGIQLQQAFGLSKPPTSVEDLTEKLDTTHAALIYTTINVILCRLAQPFEGVEATEMNRSLDLGEMQKLAEDHFAVKHVFASLAANEAALIHIPGNGPAKVEPLKIKETLRASLTNTSEIPENLEELARAIKPSTKAAFKEWVAYFMSTLQAKAKAITIVEAALLAEKNRHDKPQQIQILETALSQNPRLKLVAAAMAAVNGDLKALRELGYANPELNAQKVREAFAKAVGLKTTDSNPLKSAADLYETGWRIAKILNDLPAALERELKAIPETPKVLDRIPPSLKNREAELNAALEEVVMNDEARQIAERDSRPFYQAYFVRGEKLFAALKAGSTKELTDQNIETEILLRLNELKELMKPKPKPIEITEVKGYQELTDAMQAIRDNNTAFAEARSIRNDKFYRGFTRGDTLAICLRAGARNRPLDTPEQISAEMQRQAAKLKKLLEKHSAVSNAKTLRSRPTPTAVTRVFRNDVDSIPQPALRAAVAAKSPEEQDRFLECFELMSQEAEGIPTLQRLQNRMDTQAEPLFQAVAMGDSATIDQALNRFLMALTKEFTPEVRQHIQRERDEKTLREVIVSFYRTPELVNTMQRLMTIMTLAPELITSTTDRRYLERVQSAIRAVLHEEIPDIINSDATKEKDIKKRIAVLEGTDIRRTRDTAIQKRVEDKIAELMDLVKGLPPDITGTPPATPTGRSATGAVDDGLDGLDDALDPFVAVAPGLGPTPPPRPARPTPTPPTGLRLATPPAAPARGPNYPPANTEITDDHVRTLMERVLEKRSLYNSSDPVCQAIINLLQNNADRIDMATLESTLRAPGQTNPAVAALEQQSTDELTEAERVAKGEIRDIDHTIEDLRDRKKATRVTEAEAERLQNDINRLRREKAGLEDSMANIQLARQRKAGAIRYKSPRQALCMVIGYLNPAISEDEMVEQMEEEVRIARRYNEKTEGVVSRYTLGLLRPSLKDTLTHLTKEDKLLKKHLKPEDVKELAKAYDSYKEVKDWLEGLSVDENIKYNKILPTLIVYLEMAARAGNMSGLNTASRGYAEELIGQLKRVQHEHIKDKVDTQFNGQAATPLARMSAYAAELQRVTLKEEDIKEKYITNLGRKRIAQRLAIGIGGGAAIAAGGWAYGLLGTVGRAILVSAGPSLAIAGGAKAAEKGLKYDKKYNAPIYRGAWRTARGVGAMTALSTVASVASPWLLAPVGIIAAAPEIVKIYKAQFDKSTWSHHLWGPLKIPAKLVESVTRTGLFVANPSNWFEKT